MTSTLDFRSHYKTSVIKSLWSWSLNKQTAGNNKEYPEIDFSVGRNLIYVKMMVKVINDRMFYS